MHNSLLLILENDFEEIQELENRVAELLYPYQETPISWEKEDERQEFACFFTLEEAREERSRLLRGYREALERGQFRTEESFAEWETPLPRHKIVMTKEFLEYNYRLSKEGSLREFMGNIHNYVWSDKAQGFGYYENPSAYWDWYEIGGRYRNTLQLKGGGITSIAQARELDDAFLRNNFSTSCVLSEDIGWKSREEQNPIGRRIWDKVIPFRDLKSLYEKYIKGIKKYFKRDGENWILKEEQKIDNLDSNLKSLLRYTKWIENFYSNFLEGIEEDSWLVIVDLHI